MTSAPALTVRSATSNEYTVTLTAMKLKAMISRGKCVISSRWVFKIKADGTYKTRCVGRGFQQWKTEVDNNFAPVARLGTVRCLMALAAIYDLDLWQQDVVCAFLNAKLGPED